MSGRKIMDMESKWTRIDHARAIAARWWFVMYAAWTMLATADTLVAHYASAAFRENWARWWWIPIRGLKTWLVGMCVITIVVIFEGSFRLHRRQALEHGIELQNLGEKITQLSNSHRPRISLSTSSLPSGEWWKLTQGDPPPLFLVTNTGGDAARFVQIQPVNALGRNVHGILKFDQLKKDVLPGTTVAVPFQYQIRPGQRARENDVHEVKMFFGNVPAGFDTRFIYEIRIAYQCDCETYEQKEALLWDSSEMKMTVVPSPAVSES